MILKEEPYKELGRIKNPKIKKNRNHQDNKIEESAGV